MGKFKDSEQFCGGEPSAGDEHEFSDRPHVALQKFIRRLQETAVGDVVADEEEARIGGEIKHHARGRASDQTARRGSRFKSARLSPPMTIREPGSGVLLDRGTV